MSKSKEELQTRIDVLERILLEAFNDLPPVDVTLSPDQVQVLEKITAVLGLPSLEMVDVS